MKVDVTPISSESRTISVEIPIEKVQSEMKKMLEELRHGVQIPGFRVGKVPDSILKMRFGKEIRKQIGANLIETTLFDAIDEAGITLVGPPEMKEWVLEEENPFSYAFTATTLPDFDVAAYKGVEIEKVIPQVKDEVVTERLERLAQSQASFDVVSDRPSAAGDRLYGKIKLMIGEEIVPGWRGRNVDIALGEGRFFPGSDFEQKLIGLMPGTEHVFEVVFPEDYKYYVDFAGKTVSVNCDLKELKTKMVPKLDDDFAKDIGVESIEQLTSRIREDLATEQKSLSDRDYRMRLLDKITEGTQFEIPEFMIKAELDDMREEMKLSEDKDWEELLPKVQPIANKKVKLRLLLERIAHLEGIVVTSEEIDQEIQKALNSEEATREIEARSKDPAVRSQVRRSLKRERAIRLIVDSAVVKDVDALSEPAKTEENQQN